jgi:hypothetical protein
MNRDAPVQCSCRIHHLNQDKKPNREEAELLVGLTAMVATYWSKKYDRPMAMRRDPTVA